MGPISQLKTESAELPAFRVAGLLGLISTIAGRDLVFRRSLVANSANVVAWL